MHTKAHWLCYTCTGECTVSWKFVIFPDTMQGVNILDKLAVITSSKIWLGKAIKFTEI